MEKTVRNISLLPADFEELASIGGTFSEGVRRLVLWYRRELKGKDKLRLEYNTGSFSDTVSLNEWNDERRSEEEMMMRNYAASCGYKRVNYCVVDVMTGQDVFRSWFDVTTE